MSFKKAEGGADKVDTGLSQLAASRDASLTASINVVELSFKAESMNLILFLYTKRCTIYRISVRGSEMCCSLKLVRYALTLHAYILGLGQRRAHAGRV